MAPRLTRQPIYTTALRYLPLLFLVLLGWTGDSVALPISYFNEAKFSAALHSGKPVAVLFSAPWCSNCSKVERNLVSLEPTSPTSRLVVLKADFETFYATAQRLEVKTPSTVIFFRGGREVSRIVGVRETIWLKDWFFGSDSAPLNDESGQI